MGCGTFLPPAVIGGLIVGIFALLGIFLTHMARNRRDKKRQQEIIKGVLQAFYVELKVTWERYDKRVGDYWKEFEKGRVAIFYDVLPIHHDYLTIYRSNANYIGQINDSKLRLKIVEVYTLLQDLMESYRSNAKFLNKYWGAQHEWNEAITKQNTAEATLKAQLSFEASSDLMTQAPKLKEQHNHLKGLIENLLKTLKPRCNV